MDNHTAKILVHERGKAEGRTRRAFDLALERIAELEGDLKLLTPVCVPLSGKPDRFQDKLLGVSSGRYSLVFERGEEHHVIFRAGDSRDRVVHRLAELARTIAVPK